MRSIQNPTFSSVSPVTALSPLAREFDRIFSLGHALASRNRDARSWTLPLDIEETASSITIKADLPGIDRSSIKISLEDGLLTISASRAEESRKADGTSLYQERRYGSFERSVQLPVEVPADKVKASTKDGVLTIVLAKEEAAKPKQIQVEVE
jgi:HSP20 family protein